LSAKKTAGHAQIDFRSIFVPSLQRSLDSSECPHNRRIRVSISSRPQDRVEK
jgi:hypothetical protein